MARNRKNQSDGLRFGPALKASLICLVIVIFCVGFVWQKKQISELSHQIRSRESNRDGLHDKNDKLKKQLAGLLSPTALDARVKELKLGLSQPDPTKIWRLPEPVADKPAPEPAQQFAAEKSASDLP